MLLVPNDAGPSALGRSLLDADVSDMNFLKRVDRALEASSSGKTTTTTTTKPLQPYLRDAAITCVPHLTDDQLERIEAEVLTKCHYALTSRLTDCTVLVQGIAIKADSPLDADRIAWARMNLRAHTALCQPNDINTRITSIDISSSSGLH